MSDSRRQQGGSPHAYSLPSFSSLSGAASRAESSSSHLRRPSVTEGRSDDINHALRQEIMVRDNTIAMLRSEQSRLQTLCDQLDAKSQIMDRELAAMTEERAELRKATNELSAQVESLQADKQVLQNQSQADAAQWRQIMSMSSKLQMQNVEESRRFNADREHWDAERERLEQRILSLQPDLGLQRVNTQSSPDIMPETSSSQQMLALSLNTLSEDQLRQQPSNLRERCQDLEDLLTTILKEAGHIERVSGILKEARRRMTTPSPIATSPMTVERLQRDSKRPRS